MCWTGRCHRVAADMRSSATGPSNYLRCSRRACRNRSGFFNDGITSTSVQQHCDSETSPRCLPQRFARPPGVGWLQNTSCRPCASATSSADLADHTGFDGVQRQSRMQSQRHAPHPGGGELMRILVDEHDLPWTKPGDHLPPRPTPTTRCFRGAGEVAVTLLDKVWPRHLQLIYESNRRFLAGGRRGPATTAALARSRWSGGANQAGPHGAPGHRRRPTRQRRRRDTQRAGARRTGARRYALRRRSSTKDQLRLRGRWLLAANPACRLTATPRRRLGDRPGPAPRPMEPHRTTRFQDIPGGEAQNKERLAKSSHRRHRRGLEATASSTPTSSAPRVQRAAASTCCTSCMPI